MKEKKYGFIDKTGRFVIEPIFDEAGCFHEGLAYVKKGDRYSYIDKSGKIVMEPSVDNCIGCGSFHEGLASIRVPYMMGFIDKSGELVAHYYSLVSPYHEGLSRVKNNNNEVGYIDKDGQWVIPPKFEDARDFHEGLAQVVFDRKGDNPKYGFIDRNGDVVIAPQYKFGLKRCDFSEGLAYIALGNGKAYCPNDKFGYIDKTGQIVIKPNFIMARGFHEGLALVRTKKNGGFIDKSGIFVFTVSDQFAWISDFSDNLAVVESNGKYGYLGKTGDIVIEPQFEFATDFSEGYACVYSAGKYGFIDKDGNIVVEPQFESDSAFYGGLACVAVEREVNQSTIINPIQTTKQSTTEGKSKEGCYIATAIYSSYDCPEVWTLRRYRDNILNDSWHGRLFIRVYYAVSPTLVKWFGESSWFRKLFRKPLNKWILKLNQKGFSNTPYMDKY